jgi:hypothetical protein
MAAREALHLMRSEFRFGPVPLDEAVGKLLAHNVAGSDGRPALRKGRPLTADDVALLRGLGRSVVYIAEPGTDDLDEDTAALRIAQAAMGPGLRLRGPGVGRANLLAAQAGVFRVDPSRLLRFNECEGLTIATLRAHTPVREGQVVATVKVIPFAVPATVVAAAEGIAASGEPLLKVDPLGARTVSLVLSGSTSARERLTRDLEPPLRSRLEALGASLRAVAFVALDDERGETALAEALLGQVAQGAEMILLAGETAIVDRHDIAPRAIERAGGDVVAFGAPVDPGNLLLLAYLGTVPILGAPGCARSRKDNVVDLVLPRLLAGDRLRRGDIAALGYGGLLEDWPERPTPRGQVG